MMANAVTDLQQQGDGKLADGTGAVHRHIGYRDPLLPGVIDIHHIVAGGLHGDESHSGTGIDDLLRDGRLVGDHHLCAADATDDLRRVISVGAVVNGYFAQLVQSLLIQISGIDGITVQNHDFHCVSPLAASALPAHLQNAPDSSLAFSSSSVKKQR